MKPKHTGNRILVAMATTESNMADILNLEGNQQIAPRDNRKWISLLPGATTGFKMATKHEIQGNALRAHLRQEVEFSPWLLSERLYKFNE